MFEEDFEYSFFYWERPDGVRDFRISHELCIDNPLSWRLIQTIPTTRRIALYLFLIERLLRRKLR